MNGRPMRQVVIVGFFLLEDSVRDRGVNGKGDEGRLATGITAPGRF
jgi:hypothetical protein